MSPSTSPPRLSLRRSLLWASVLALAIFSSTTLAQDTAQDTNTPQGTNSPQPTNTDNTNTPQPSNTGRSSTNNNNSQRSSSTGKDTPSITNTGAQNTATNSRNLPTITGGADATNSGKLNLPTLSSTRDNSIPTYAVLVVPPTENAPFMQHSTAPEGTVFIAVGAILGAFGLTVLVWRGVVACLLHRSVERAAMMQHHAIDKAAAASSAFPAPPAPFYKSTFHDRDSSPNLLGANGGPTASSASLGRGVRRTHRGPTPSATPSQSNLFFSPTAASGVGGGIGGGGPGSISGGNNRDSRFLPSGFYAAGSASPANGVRHEHSISLSNLRPDSRGHARAAPVSPPDSPSLGPSPSRMGSGMQHPMQRNVSTSTLNLNRPPSGRAPSAFLDDMLDDPGSHGVGPHNNNFPGGRPGSHFSNSPSPLPHGPYSPSPGPRDPFGGSPNGGRF